MSFPTDSSGNTLNEVGRHSRQLLTGGFQRDVARGNIPGVRPFEGYGDGLNLNGNNLDIWVGPTDQQPEPVTTGYQPNIISSSVQDIAGGTGAFVVEIHYLDTMGELQDENVTLNGTTAVNMVATNVMFINYVHVVELGTPGTSIASAGNIDARNGTTVMNRILATENVSLSTMRMVPVGHSLFIDGWRADGIATTTKTAKIRLRSTTHDEHSFVEQNQNLPGVYHFIDVAGVKDSSTGWITLSIPFKVSPLATVKISAWTTGSMNISASWRGCLEPCP